MPRSEHITQPVKKRGGDLKGCPAFYPCECWDCRLASKRNKDAYRTFRRKEKKKAIEAGLDEV